jgi:hypothetical protein
MKKGISLIVLVITIIIIIILAGSVILSIAKSNPISDAKSASTGSNGVEIQSATNVYLTKIMTAFKDDVKIEEKTESGPNISINGAGAQVVDTTGKPIFYGKNSKIYVSAVDQNAAQTKLNEANIADVEAVKVSGPTIGVDPLPEGTWLISTDGVVTLQK